MSVDQMFSIAGGLASVGWLLLVVVPRRALALHVVRDVSERKRLEQRLRESEKMEALGRLEIDALLPFFLGSGNEKSAVDTALHLLHFLLFKTYP